MAPRLSKRQLREMAELAELSSNHNIPLTSKNDEEDGEEEEELELKADNNRLNKSMFDAVSFICLLFVLK